MTPLKETIEEIFSPDNIDDDCDNIASEMREYEKVMKSYIASSGVSTAVTIFIEVAKSLACHFVKDEHYNYFDDYYCPDYEITDIMDRGSYGYEYKRIIKL